MVERHTAPSTIATAKAMAPLVAVSVSPFDSSRRVPAPESSAPRVAPARAESRPGCHAGLLLSGDLGVPQRSLEAALSFGLTTPPSRAHGLDAPCALRRRDWFVQHVMGPTPRDDSEITRPAGAWLVGVGTSDDDPSHWR